jgi:hypothetical protein
VFFKTERKVSAFVKGTFCNFVIYHRQHFLEEINGFLLSQGYDDSD